MPPFLLALLAAWLPWSCQPATPPPSPAPAATGSTRPLAFKGWELYSWQDATGWRYALLVGTNRNKGTDEILAAARDLDAVLAAIASFSPGEQLFWEPPTFPPEDTIQRVQEACDRAGVKLALLR